MLSYGHVERQVVHIFEIANLSGYDMWDFTTKEELNTQKQVFLLNLSLWPAQKPKFWSIFFGKKLIQEHYVV